MVLSSDSFLLAVFTTASFFTVGSAHDGLSSGVSHFCLCLLLWHFIEPLFPGCFSCPSSFCLCHLNDNTLNVNLTRVFIWIQIILTLSWSFLCTVWRLDNLNPINSSIPGGVVLEKQYFDPSCTHIVVGHPLRNEKFLASMAAGKWVLHRSYLEACRGAGCFVQACDPVTKTFVCVTFLHLFLLCTTRKRQLHKNNC